MLERQFKDMCLKGNGVATGNPILTISLFTIDSLRHALYFEQGKKNAIYDHCSSKEHRKISNIAKFACEMLQNSLHCEVQNCITGGKGLFI